MNGEAALRQKAQTFLTQVVQQNDKLLGALLVSPDGLLIAHHLLASDHVDKIAAMATALHALGREIGMALALGECGLLHVRFREGETYMIGAGACTLALAARAQLDPRFLEAVAQQAGGQF